MLLYVYIMYNIYIMYIEFLLTYTHYIQTGQRLPKSLAQLSIQ